MSDGMVQCKACGRMIPKERNYCYACGGNEDKPLRV